MESINPKKKKTPPPNSETPLYVKFTEYNEWEGESWNFFIPINGNREAIKKLRKAIKVYLEKSDLEEFTLSTDTLTESEIDTLIKHANDHTSYRSAQNKLKGLLCGDMIQKNTIADLLYKGGIIKLMKEQ